jgi:hypothetical protein
MCGDILSFDRSDHRIIRATTPTATSGYLQNVELHDLDELSGLPVSLDQVAVRRHCVCYETVMKLCDEPLGRALWAGEDTLSGKATLKRKAERSGSVS